MVDRLELAYSEDAGWAFKGAEHNAAAAPVQAVLNDHEAISYRRARPPAQPAAVRGSVRSTHPGGRRRPLPPSATWHAAGT